MTLLLKQQKLVKSTFSCIKVKTIAPNISWEAVRSWVLPSPAGHRWFESSYCEVTMLMVKIGKSWDGLQRRVVLCWFFGSGTEPRLLVGV